LAVQFDEAFAGDRAERALDFGRAHVPVAHEVRDHLVALGINPAASTPGELELEIRSEQAKWKKVIEISGAKAE